MITVEHQGALSSWLCEKIGLVPTPDLVCIGNRDHAHIYGVVGYDQFNGASIMMHAAGEGYWLNKDMLFAVFDYPFNVCKANMVIGLVPSGNEAAIRFNTHIGFRTELRLEGAHPDGALLLMTMKREECRYLSRKRNGQEKQSTSATRLH